MKTALEILNQVEPNGELLDTEKAIEFSQEVVKEIAAEIKKECYPVSIINDEWFSGTSWAQICRILGKYGFTDIIPF